MITVKQVYSCIQILVYITVALVFTNYRFNLIYHSNMRFCTALDELGHGVRSNTPRSKSRTSQGSMQSLAMGPAVVVGVGPAPTTKPPTPPQARGVTVGTLKGSQYRTPPAVAPPQASTLRRRAANVRDIVICISMASFTHCRLWKIKERSSK